MFNPINTSCTMKRYITPATQVASMIPESIITGSMNSVDSNAGIQYGGGGNGQGRVKEQEGDQFWDFGWEE
ncbi:MAG: hypothetical protein K6A32_08255 [Bacteroidales bacterium]|nr:hypothetical protein [Bacteroidales bacterium]